MKQVQHGIPWNTKHPVYNFSWCQTPRVHIKEVTCSRRNIYIISCSLQDPTGFFSLYTPQYSLLGNLFMKYL